MLRVAADDASSVHVPAGVIAQAWRDGARQALLARALSRCEEIVLDGPTARLAGLLCGRAGIADVIDSSVAVAAATVASRSDVAVLTSDPNDLTQLIDVLDATVNVVTV